MVCDKHLEQFIWDSVTDGRFIIQTIGLNMVVCLGIMHLSSRHPSSQVTLLLEYQPHCYFPSIYIFFMFGCKYITIVTIIIACTV